VVTIDDLPDEVLLEIFDFHVFKFQGLDLLGDIEYDRKRGIEKWQSLVHVCRRWRGLVFGSPRRLNLNICYSRRSARKSLDVWPTLPLVILGGCVMGYDESVDNIIAVLKHSDRIRRIALGCYKKSLMKKICSAMQVPFPELVVMDLSFGRMSYVLPDSFLDGSTPRLQFLRLNSIPFPGLPKLLLCATHLVKLYLLNIPLSEYISPEAMTTCLSALTSLKSLRLGFNSPQFPPDLKSRRPLSPIRSVLPTLTIFRFNVTTKYLEDFVARIDTPRLNWLLTGFFNDTPKLNQFISRTPTLGPYDEAHVFFSGQGALARLRQSHPESSDPRVVEIEIAVSNAFKRGANLYLITALPFNN
jgi:hypothetical protein